MRQVDLFTYLIINLTVGGVKLADTLHKTAELLNIHFS